MKSKSSQPSSKATSLLLLVVMAQWVCRHLLPLLPVQAADLAWNIADVLRAVGMAATLGLCVALTPWRMLRLKCLLAAFCGYYVSDAIVCATWYAWNWPSPILMLSIQGASFLAAAIYYWRRSYAQPSDKLEHGYLFSVRHIPSNAQDFIISLSGLYGADGAYSLYANGFIYKFSDGRLVRRKVSTLPVISYHVTRGDKCSAELIAHLDSLIGMPWTLNKNCLTVLGRIWRQNSGRAY